MCGVLELRKLVQQALLGIPHDPGLTAAYPLMIKTEQMEGAVYQEAKYFLFRGNTLLARLSLCGRKRDYHVPEGCAACRAALPCEQGERQYVCGLVLFAVREIQRMNLCVVGEQ